MDIVKAEVTAMDSGWASGNKTTFEVNMLLDGWRTMYKINFYIGMDLEVDTRLLAGDRKMYTITKYTES